MGGTYMYVVIGLIGVVMIYLFNITMTNRVKTKSLRYYHNTNHVTDSVHYLRKLFNRQAYVVYIITIISLLVLSVIVGTEFISFQSEHIFVYLFISLIIYFFIVIQSNKIIKSAERQIRDLKTNKQQELMITKMIVFYFFHISLFFGLYILITLFSYHIVYQNLAFVWYGLGILVILFILLLLGKKSIPIYQKIFKAYPLEDDEIETFVHSFSIPKLRIQQVDTDDIRLANALAVGTDERIIFVTSYLMNQFTIDEQKAVIAHELGHFKHNHLIKRSYYLMRGFLYELMIMIILTFIYQYTNIHFLFIVLFPLFILSIYYYFFKKAKLYQKQETEADSFMIQAGVNKEAIISMLQKLAQLNAIKEHDEGYNERFKYHPSIQKRIDAIISHK